MVIVWFARKTGSRARLNHRDRDVYATAPDDISGSRRGEPFWVTEPAKPDARRSWNLWALSNLLAAGGLALLATPGGTLPDSAV